MTDAKTVLSECRTILGDLIDARAKRIRLGMADGYLAEEANQLQALADDALEALAASQARVEALERIAFEARGYLDVVDPAKPNEAVVVVSAGFVRRVAALAAAPNAPSDESQVHRDAPDAASPRQGRIETHTTRDEWGNTNTVIRQGLEEKG
jgi:hypothetical protein